MASPISVYYNIADAKGNVSTTTIPIPSTTPLATAQSFARAMGELLKPLCTGELRDMGFSVSVNPTSSWGVADAVSDVQEKATFGFRTVGKWLKKISLPTFLESLFTPNSKQVNTADPAVAAFITACEDGIEVVPGTTVLPCDGREDDLDALETAVESWGKARG